MPWKPGQSGNPAGRVKGKRLFDIAPAARQFGPEALQTLVDCLKDDRWKVPAAIALLDRGYGKPTQTITGNPDQPLSFEIVWGPARAPATNALANGDGNADAATIDGEAEAEDAEVVWGNGDGSE